MRLLIWHVSQFKSAPKDRGRSRVISENSGAIDTGESLLVFACAEKGDERDMHFIMGKSADEILVLSQKLKVDTVVLHSFAHLFAELGEPQDALDILNGMQQKLLEMGLKAFQTPFGWFNEMEIKAKGHPLSRISRQISPTVD